MEIRIVEDKWIAEILFAPQLLRIGSDDLQDALENADRLAADMKEELRRRLAN
jgi:hypothetical protein